MKTISLAMRCLWKFKLVQRKPSQNQVLLDWTKRGKNWKITNERWRRVGQNGRKFLKISMNLKKCFLRTLIRSCPSEEMRRIWFNNSSPMTTRTWNAWTRRFILWSLIISNHRVTICPILNLCWSRNALPRHFKPYQLLHRTTIRLTV